MVYQFWQGWRGKVFALIRSIDITLYRCANVRGYSAHSLFSSTGTMG
jgi:hypothetical protein